MQQRFCERERGILSNKQQQLNGDAKENCRFNHFLYFSWTRWLHELYMFVAPTSSIRSFCVSIRVRVDDNSFPRLKLRPSVTTDTSTSTFSHISEMIIATSVTYCVTITHYFLFTYW